MAQRVLLLFLANSVFACSGMTSFSAEKAPTGRRGWLAGGVASGNGTATGTGTASGSSGSGTSDTAYGDAAVSGPPWDSGGVENSNGGGSSAYDPMACRRTSDGMSFGAWKNGTLVVGCSLEPGYGPRLTVSGIITAVTQRSFTIDACPPDSDCSPTSYLFEVNAPGLTMPFSEGSLVQIEAQRGYRDRHLVPWGLSGAVSPRVGGHARSKRSASNSAFGARRFDRPVR